MTHNSRLLGIGAVVPSTVVTNEELSHRLDTSDAWIRQRTGIGQRHVAVGDVSTSELATEAGRRALANSGHLSADIVLVATTTPDQSCPAIAPLVATRLGLVAAAAFDIAAVCAGFVTALAVGDALVRSAKAERVVVIGADVFTSIIDPADRTTAVIFGDAAGAVVLGRDESLDAGTLISTDLGSDGGGYGLMGTSSSPSRGGGPRSHGYFTMEGPTVFRRAVDSMVTSSRQALRDASWHPSEVDAVIAHQANIRILNAVADGLDIARASAYANLDRRGNTSAASIPLALVDATLEGRLHSGDRVLLTAFGGGLAWGSTCLTWPTLMNLPVAPEAPLDTEWLAAV